MKKLKSKSPFSLSGTLGCSEKSDVALQRQRTKVRSLISLTLNNKEKKYKNKKAVFFSSDALMALVIILLTILVAYPAIKYSKHENLVKSDVIQVLSTLKIGEIDNSYVQSLISEGKITDMNKSILEQIGEFYVTDVDTAKAIAESVLSGLDTKDNIGIWYGNKLIFSRNSSAIETAKDIDVERQIISGIREGENLEGFSARAFLTNSLQSKYFYFGGYVGDGNLSARVDYTGEIKNIKVEIAINKDFDIYINDIFSGHYEKSVSEFSPAIYNLDSYLSNFHSGINEIKFVGDNLHITGGYIKINYDDSVFYEQPTRKYFPGMEGVINLYDGFYVPGDLNNLKVSLHLDTNYMTFLTIGNTTVFESLTSGEQTRMLANSELASLLDYSAMSRKTIPIRLGLYELQGGLGGNADVVLITDLSDSMESRLDSDSNGVTRNCNDSNLYNSDTKRISLAKCLDKMVIDIILNVSGNRMALSGFYGDLRSPYKGRVYQENLNIDATYLKSRVEAYNPQGGTPLCAAINDAYKILNEQSSSNRSKFVIVMSDGIPTHTCQAASGCEGTRTGLPNDEALWLGWGAGCYGGLDDCNVNDCACASQNANWSSCRLHNELDAVVYSVGFGPVSSCQMAASTLGKIADCGGGSYYASNNATLLEQFYRSIAEEILEISYTEQVSQVVGDINVKLYPDSFIEFNYTKQAEPYGLITTLEKKFDDVYYGHFSIPQDSRILEATAISYSGPRWTHSVEVNNTSVYKLNDYGSDYNLLGDPYAINLPTSFVKSGSENIVKITTGTSPENSTSGSADNKIIYTIARNLSAYSAIVASAEGCIWTVQFEDGNNLTLNVPLNYTGADNCYYQESVQEHNNNDALQAAVYNLLRLLDVDLNNKVDVKFTEQDLQISSSEVKGIPYTWSTEVQVRTWG